MKWKVDHTSSKAVSSTLEKSRRLRSSATKSVFFFRIGFGLLGVRTLKRPSTLLLVKLNGWENNLRGCDKGRLGEEGGGRSTSLL